MAEHLDVDPAVLEGISRSFDDESLAVDQLTLPGDVDGGIASADILLLLAELSLDIGSIAGGMHTMALQLSETRRLYVESDAEAAEAIFLAGGGE